MSKAEVEQLVELLVEKIAKRVFWQLDLDPDVDEWQEPGTRNAIRRGLDKYLVPILNEKCR